MALPADPRVELLLWTAESGPGPGWVEASVRHVRAASTTAGLLDTYSPKAHGGTGAAFDWQLIEKLELSKPFILAGGLYPGNAQAALAVQPYALDANSGLEDAPGIKNHSLIRQFLAQVRAAERALAGQ